MTDPVVLDIHQVESDFLDTEHVISDSYVFVIRASFSEKLGHDIPHIESIEELKALLVNSTHDLIPFTFSLIGYSVAGLLNRHDKKMLYHDAYGSNLSSSYKRLIKDALPGYYIETLLKRNQKAGENSSAVFAVLNAYNLYMREMGRSLYDFTSETLRQVLWDDLVDQLFEQAEIDASQKQEAEALSEEVAENRPVEPGVQHSRVVDTYERLREIKKRSIERKLEKQRQMFQNASKQDKD